MDITINGAKIKRVREFWYLGRILTEDDDDGRCIEENLRSARKKWIAIS